MALGEKPVAYPIEHGFDEMKILLPIMQACMHTMTHRNGFIPRFLI